jgi:hypothetical protein
MNHYQLQALFVIFYMLSTNAIEGQTFYSHRFKKELNKMGAEFISPVEGYYKVKLKSKDRYMKYDLILHSEDHDLEMRLVLDPDYRHSVPHITTFNLVNTLAVNSAQFDIHLNLLPEDQAQAEFNASWVSYADFIPKRSLSEKQYGRLVSAFHPDKGMLYTLMLFNRQDEEKDRRSYTLQFANP